MKNYTWSLLISLILLTGCSTQQQYVLYDASGCAFVVSRSVLNQGNGEPFIKRGEWERDKTYKADIKRLPDNDRPSCTITSLKE